MPSRSRTVAALLAGLTGHFYRPEMAQGLAKQVLLDFIEDLADFDISDIEAAVKTYRQNPVNKKFPSPGQLRELAIVAQRERRARAEHQSSTPRSVQFERPNLWWMIPREHWSRFGNWMESEVPWGEKIRHNGVWRFADDGRHA